MTQTETALTGSTLSRSLQDCLALVTLSECQFVTVGLLPAINCLITIARFNLYGVSTGRGYMRRRRKTRSSRKRRRLRSYRRGRKKSGEAVTAAAVIVVVVVVIKTTPNDSQNFQTQTFTWREINEHDVDMSNENRREETAYNYMNLVK